jgi:hypothetical protein
MPTPSNRTPLRVARGTYSNLNSSVSDIQEGEICYATDQDKLYVKEGGSLVSTQADVSAKANTSDIGTTIQPFDADTAKTDINQTFTAAQAGAITTDSSSVGVLEINFNDSNNFQISLLQNITSVLISGGTAGQSGSIFITQPSSGSVYTVGGWAAGFKFSGATAPTITATNGVTDRVDYVIRTASGGNATEIQVVWTGNY